MVKARPLYHVTRRDSRRPLSYRSWPFRSVRTPLETRTMPARTSSLAETLSVSIPKIFDQAQNTTANHQKNVVALHKIHSDAAAFTESVHNGRSIKLTGERLFEDAFIDVLCRVLVIKKGVSQAERIVKFVGAYTKYMNEQGQ